jgi:hypothetical protein
MTRKGHVLLNMMKNDQYGCNSITKSKKTKTTTQAPLVEEHVKEANVAEPVAEAPVLANPNQCPKCNKVFKRLSMHKCK